MKIDWRTDYTKKTTVFYTTWMAENDEWTVIYDWCNENFNAENWDFWYDVLKGALVEQLIKCHFEFKNDDDILAFRLKWC